VRFSSLIVQRTDAYLSAVLMTSLRVTGGPSTAPPSPDDDVASSQDMVADEIRQQVAAKLRSRIRIADLQQD